jgi:hypothetical protein
LNTHPWRTYTHDTSRYDWNDTVQNLKLEVNGNKPPTPTPRIHDVCYALPCRVGNSQHRRKPRIGSALSLLCPQLVNVCLLNCSLACFLPCRLSVSFSSFLVQFCPLHVSSSWNISGCIDRIQYFLSRHRVH